MKKIVAIFALALLPGCATYYSGDDDGAYYVSGPTYYTHGVVMTERYWINQGRYPRAPHYRHNDYRGPGNSGPKARHPPPRPNWNSGHRPGSGHAAPPSQTKPPGKKPPVLRPTVRQQGHSGQPAHTQSGASRQWAPKAPAAPHNRVGASSGRSGGGSFGAHGPRR
jgi:hypothetical protein